MKTAFLLSNFCYTESYLHLPRRQSIVFIAAPITVFAGGYCLGWLKEFFNRHFFKNYLKNQVANNDASVEPITSQEKAFFPYAYFWAPITEEILFRHFYERIVIPVTAPSLTLFGEFKLSCIKPIYISAITFALGHNSSLLKEDKQCLSLSARLIYEGWITTHYFIMSCLLSMVRDKFGLIASITLHAGINLGVIHKICYTSKTPLSESFALKYFFSKDNIVQCCYSVAEQTICNPLCFQFFRLKLIKYLESQVC